MNEILTRYEFENLILPSATQIYSPTEGRLKLLKHDAGMRALIEELQAATRALLEELQKVKP